MDNKTSGITIMNYKENKESKKRMEGIHKHYEENIDYIRELQNKKPATTFYKILRDKELSITMSYLAGKIRHSESQRVLDIGCNTGRFIKALIDKGVQCIGIDTAKIPLSYAKKWVPEAEFIRASITELPFAKKSFDIVICIELFHHLPNEILEEGIEEIAKVIKPEGVFIFDIKNKLNPVLNWAYKEAILLNLH